MSDKTTSKQTHLRLIAGGGSGPMNDEAGEPFPASPRKGLRFMVIQGRDSRFGYNVVVRRVSGRSFEVAVDGQRHLLPLAGWRDFLESQVAEGRLCLVEPGVQQPRRWPQLVVNR